MSFIKKLAATLLMLVSMVSASASADNCQQCTDSAHCLKGKTVIFFGDSYVRNHKRPYSEAWHARAAEELGMNYVNFGRNGSCVAYDRTKDGFGPAMTERYKEMPDTADFVVIIAGHNDAGKVAEMGMEHLPEVRAALDTLIDSLREKYPQATIGFVTPWRVDRPGFEEVIGEIRKMCEAKNVPLLDMASLGVIDPNNPDFRARYFQGPTDTAHLNAAGHSLLVPMGKAFLQLLTVK